MLTEEKPVYFDYNATTPLVPEVIEAMRPFLEEHFGNPSSNHIYGYVMRDAVSHARNQVAKLLGATPEEIVFTSGGTESNNHALKGVARACQHRGNHIITSVTEHPAVLQVCGWLSRNGFDITYLPVDGNGRVDPDALRQKITNRTVIVSIMHANNETGTIGPIRALADIAHAHGALMHTDAAQSVGKIPVRVDALGVDLLSVAGHKVYAPKGIGALYIRCGTPIEPLMHGAGHENGCRAGTENVLEIVGLGAACEIVRRDGDKIAAHLKSVTSLLLELLTASIPETQVNGYQAECLPNTLNISFLGVDAHLLLEALRKDVAASAGARPAMPVKQLYPPY